MLPYYGGEDMHMLFMNRRLWMCERRAALGQKEYLFSV